MVPEVRGGDLDDGLAPSYSNDIAVEAGHRSNHCRSGAAADEFLRYGTMDGISRICSDHGSDDRKLWNGNRFPRTESMVIGRVTRGSTKVAQSRDFITPSKELKGGGNVAR